MSKLTKEQIDDIADLIYESIISQDFFDWYNGKFEDHVTAEEGCMTVEETTEEIKQQFSLNRLG